MVNKYNLNKGSLPIGLKIAVSTSVEGSKKVLQNVKEIKPETSMFDLRETSQDNVLSLMKKPDGIKLAICVCMYSETRSMLKSTLAGIAENIANLVAYEGMDPDDIGVFVMMDGIEKVDKSILDYYDELEKSSHIHLADNLVSSLTIQQIEDRRNEMSEDEMNAEEMKNVNNFLFETGELEVRNAMRFETIRANYLEVKQLRKTIE